MFITEQMGSKRSKSLHDAGKVSSNSGSWRLKPGAESRVSQTRSIYAPVIASHGATPTTKSGSTVARLVLTESPVGVEYSLTKLGETLHAPVAAHCQWTSKHAAAVLDAQKSFDAKKVTHKSNASR
jgi:hypothetical protein